MWDQHVLLCGAVAAERDARDRLNRGDLAAWRLHRATAVDSEVVTQRFPAALLDADQPCRRPPAPLSAPGAAASSS